MTNRQWLLEQMQNMSDEELAEAMSEPNARIAPLLKCNEQEDCSSVVCECCIKMWLKSEHKEKPKISDAERVILENINKNFKWICRDEDGILSLFENKPVKNGNCWADSKGKYFELYVFEHIFNYLFQFITWEDTEAYNIEELLKGK